MPVENTVLTSDTSKFILTSTLFESQKVWVQSSDWGIVAKDNATYLWISTDGISGAHLTEQDVADLIVTLQFVLAHQENGGS